MVRGSATLAPPASPAVRQRVPERDTGFETAWTPESPDVWTTVHASVAGLAQFLYNVAPGDWFGPPDYPVAGGPSGQLRGFLAQAAR